MDKRDNLVLLGFMGTGKSAVGRRVAALAGCPFLEMDAELECRAGKSIARIFAEDGEEAFRNMESQLAAEWGTKEGAVISCGGGVVLREENLRALGANGVLVCLTARPEVILDRTARSKKRPLLAGEDPEKKVRALLAARAPLYAKIPNQVDTSDTDLDALAARLLDLWKKPD
ncbi:MAG TPA: shikimate kinase [Verrucomicrobia bacterium]|nr:shikimate kinase [Verrucomicrobiota bacterium]